ncbi:MAG: hypothetical protein U0360_03475 [Dehalococcoidia bacterium]
MHAIHQINVALATPGLEEQRVVQDDSKASGISLLVVSDFI